jgi:hypothetical protein
LGTSATAHNQIKGYTVFVWIAFVQRFFRERRLILLLSILGALQQEFNPLNPELNPICYLLALSSHHLLHVSRIRVKSLTLKLLMSYIHIWSAYSWCF